MRKTTDDTAQTAEHSAHTQTTHLRAGQIARYLAFTAFLLVVTFTPGVFWLMHSPWTHWVSMGDLIVAVLFFGACLLLKRQ